MDSGRKPALACFSLRGINVPVLVLLLLLTCFSACHCQRTSEQNDIHMLVMTPQSVTYPYSYQNISPAVQMATELVFRNQFISSNRKLRVEYETSNCDQDGAMLAAYNAFQNGHLDVMLGPVCDYSVAPIARQNKYLWKVPLITPGAINSHFFQTRAGNSPYLIRTGPINLSVLNEMVMNIMARHRWKKVKLLYEKRGQDEMFPEFCRHSMDYLRTILYKAGFQFDSLEISDSSAEHTLRNKIGNSYGVIVLCANPLTVRKLMIKAHELNFDNGEYIFLNIDLFPRSRKPWYLETESQESNEMALMGYKAVKTLTYRVPASMEFRQFSMGVKRRSREMFPQYTTPDSDEAIAFAAAFHDSVILYALAVNETLEANGSISDGESISISMHNRTFQGISGQVSISATGDRLVDYRLESLNPHTGNFEVEGTYYGSRGYYEPTPGRYIYWPGGKTEPPLETPTCGYDGSKCDDGGGRGGRGVTEGWTYNETYGNNDTWWDNTTVPDGWVYNETDGNNETCSGNQTDCAPYPSSRTVEALLDRVSKLEDYVATLKSCQDDSMKKAEEDVAIRLRNLEMHGHYLSQVVDNLTASRDSSGSVEAFYAAYRPTYLRWRPSGSVVTIPFSSIRVVIGQGYDKKSGVFTAPVDGLYAFHLTAYKLRQQRNLRMAIQANGMNIALMGNDNVQGQSTVSALADLHAGDEVKVVIFRKRATVYLKAGGYTTFSGYLIKSY